MNKLTKLGARRLLKLATILNTADAQHKRRKEPVYRQAALQHMCGTPACAWGHYVFSVGAKKRKAFSYLDGHGNYIVRGIDQADDEFEFSEDDRTELFGTYGCDRAVTAKEAAKYIRSFVARKGVA